MSGRDSYNYYPSDNPLADLGPPNLQNQTISQIRSLTNAGVHTDLSYVKGINTIKIGGELLANLPARKRHAGDRQLHLQFALRRRE